MEKDWSEFDLGKPDLDFGDKHVGWWYHNGEDKRIGIFLGYICPNGIKRLGTIPFKGLDPNYPGGGWDLISENPLTLSPSILIKVDGICEDHGFIQNGKWKKA